MYCLGCSIHRSTRAEIHSGCWRITSIPRNIASPSSSSLPGTALKMAISVIIIYPPCFYIYPIMPGKRLELRSTHNSSSFPPPPPPEKKKLGAPPKPRQGTSSAAPLFYEWTSDLKHIEVRM